jgi:hypothetical protein
MSECDRKDKLALFALPHPINGFGHLWPFLNINVLSILGTPFQFWLCFPTYSYCSFIIYIFFMCCNLIFGPKLNGFFVCWVFMARWCQQFVVWWRAIQHWSLWLSLSLRFTNFRFEVTTYLYTYKIEGYLWLIIRGWVPAKRRSSGGQWTKQTKRMSERGSARTMNIFYLCFL